MNRTRMERLKLGFEGDLENVEITLPEGEARPWDANAKLDVVGTEVPRIDGDEKASGRATYTFDIQLPGMLYAAVLRSPHPAAKVVSIDVAPALERAGVKAAIAVAKAGDALIFAGQDVAAVAAVRPELAEEALRGIVVKYEPRAHVVETTAAMKPGAPRVHAGKVKERRTEGDEPGTGGGAATRGNVRPLPPMKKGDVAKGQKGAKFTHEGTYTTPVQTHSALESHGIVVRWDSATKMSVWCSTQGIFSVRDEMAEVFELKPTDVTVTTDFMGGGFGAKFGASAPGSRLGFIAGELARKAKAAVHLMCTRHGEHVCTGNRPSSRQVVRLAAGADKKLRAIHVHAHGTAGIGTGAGVGRNAFGIYTKCPNILVEAHDVFTNAGPGTAMRAPGHPQGAFALELALDELATSMGADPLKLRIQTDEHPVRRRQYELGARRFGWVDARRKAARGRKRGTRIRTGAGMAASIWGDFGRPGAAVATCLVHRDGTIEIKNGVQDIGGGISTVLAQIGAEVFRRPVNSVRVLWGSSEYGSSVGSGGSQTTSSVTPAVRNAAEQAKAQLTEIAAAALGAKPSEVTWDAKGNAKANRRTMAFAQVCKRITGESIGAAATRPKTYGSHPMSFPGAPLYQIAGAQFAEVEVDTWTGVVRAKKIVAVHDCGRVMNPLTLRSQINGGIIMGTSYALMEQRVMDRQSGRMLNPNLESYKICGALDVPDIEIVITEVYTGANNTGAAGIGEPATIPTAAAIACAVYDAIGVPVRSLPLTPAAVLDALAAKAEAETKPKTKTDKGGAA